MECVYLNIHYNPKTRFGLGERFTLLSRRQHYHFSTETYTITMYTVANLKRGKGAGHGRFCVSVPPHFSQPVPSLVHDPIGTLN